MQSALLRQRALRRGDSGLAVAEHAGDLKGATHAIRSGRAIGAVYIPPRFEEDLLAARRPQIIAFYNAQYFTLGNLGREV